MPVKSHLLGKAVETASEHPLRGSIPIEKWSRYDCVQQALRTILVENQLPGRNRLRKPLRARFLLGSGGTSSSFSSKIMGS